MNKSTPQILITWLNWINSLKSPKCTQEEIDNPNSLISTKEIKSIINNSPKQETPCPDVFISEFYKYLRSKYSIYIYFIDRIKILSILYNLFQSIEAERILSNSLYEARITLIPKPHKNTTSKLQTNIS